MRAMIFAAGLGTRLKPLTDTMPKALVPLAGKTLLQWQIEKLRAAGICDIVVNVHHFPDQIIDYLRDNDNFGCSIRVSDERDALLDTGGGLRKARPLLEAFPTTSPQEPVLVCNVDILSNICLHKFISAFRDTDMGLLVVSPRDTQRYLLFNQDDRLKGWTNIATGDVRPTCLSMEDAKKMKHLAFSGMQLLSPSIFDAMDEVCSRKGDKFSLIDLYLTLTQRAILRAYVPDNYRMMDVGKINQLSEAETFAEQLTD